MKSVYISRLNDAPADSHAYTIHVYTIYIYFEWLLCESSGEHHLISSSIILTIADKYQSPFSYEDKCRVENEQYVLCFVALLTKQRFLLKLLVMYLLLLLLMLLLQSYYHESWIPSLGIFYV